LLYLLLVMLWTFLLLRLNFSYQRGGLPLDHPVNLFLGPQIFAVSLIPLLSWSGIVIPALEMDIGHFLFLACASSIFVFALIAGTNGAHVRKTPGAAFTLGSLPFWTCFVVGTTGTVILLNNIELTDPLVFILVLTSHFSYIESNFFNSSAALLWQANIAAFFWYNFVPRPNFLVKVAIGICLVSVFARGAIVYGVIAFFNYLIPLLYIKKDKKIPVIPIAVIFISVNLIFGLSYNYVLSDNYDTSIADIYFQKTYPYLSGNFINLFHHIDESFGQSLFDIHAFSELLRSMGLGSILDYISEYFGIKFQQGQGFEFRSQASNAIIYGNTSTYYGRLTFLPMSVLLPFWIALGVLVGKIYQKASGSIFYLSIHAWFSAATFLSFSTGGHFVTTRMFPALLFIWPFLLTMKIRLSKSK